MRQRLITASQALAELEWTRAAEDLRPPPVAEADVENLDDDTLQKRLIDIDGLAGRVIAAEADRIVAELAAAGDKLPEGAIREARDHRDVVVPRLIRVLRDAVTGARAGTLPEGNAHFFALFLLSEFQAAEAFPVILEAVSLPGNLPFDLFEDAITSVLARILAQFAGDRPDLLNAMIRNRELNEYVRWEAAQAFVFLVRDGRLSRDEAVARLKADLRQAIDQEDAEITGGLISVLSSFAPAEALDDIREAYDRELVDTFLIHSDDVQASIAEGEARTAKELDRCPATGIGDTIEELRTWASFQERPAPAAVPPSGYRPLPAAVLPPATYAPARRDGPRVGRNDPCPCGSDKKFKKCCGSRA